MSRTRDDMRHLPSSAHVAQAVMAVTCVALAFAASLAALGITSQLDGQLVGLVAAALPEEGPQPPPPHWIWPGAAVHALWVSAVLLHTPGWWRRWLFWLAAMAVTSGWVPVLALAAWRPEMSVPLLSVFMAGAGSLFYLSRHHQPNSVSADETC